MGPRDLRIIEARADKMTDVTALAMALREAWSANVRLATELHKARHVVQNEAEYGPTAEGGPTP